MFDDPLLWHPFLLPVAQNQDPEPALQDLIAQHARAEMLFRGRMLIPTHMSPPGECPGHQFEYSPVVMICTAGMANITLRWTAERHRGTSFHTKLTLSATEPQVLVLRDKIWFEVEWSSPNSRIFALKGEMIGFRGDTTSQFPSFYNSSCSIEREVAHDP